MTILASLTPDRTLVERALADQPSAFETLVFRYERRAHAVARAVGVRPDAVDDEVQDAFLQAFSGLGALRSPASFGSWFLSIVRNLSRKHLQKGPGASNREAVRESPHLDAREGERFRSDEKSEVGRHLWREVGRLPEGVREAILLYYSDGQSTRRVARTLGISGSAVKSRLKRGRDILRERLWEELEDSLREMLPSTRERRRRGRRLSLYVMAMLPQARASASVGGAGGTALDLGRAGASAAGENAGRGLVVSLGAGLLGMKMKSSIVVWALTIGLLAGGIGGIAVFRQKGNDGGGGGEESAPLAAGMDPEAERSTAAEDTGSVSTAIVTPPTGISGMIFLEDAPVPAPGVRIAAIRERARVHARTTSTGDDGTFLLDRLEPGKYSLWAWWEDWTTRWPEQDDGSIDVRRGRVTEDVSGTLIPGVILEGRVLEEGTGVPIHGARVDFANLQFATTDPEGRFRLEGIPEGLILISAVAPGHSWSHEFVDVANGEEPFTTLHLPPGGVIEGRVTTHLGLPAADVLVTATTEGIGGGSWSDAEGQYLIEGVSLDGKSIELVASQDGFFATEMTIPGFPPGERRMEHDFSLEKGHVIRGQVLDSTGGPLPDAELLITGSLAFRRTHRTDDEGRFEFQGGSDRVFFVIARKEGHAPQVVDLRKLPPEERQDLELVLGPGHFVEGIVVDTGGAPLEDAFVYVVPRDVRLGGVRGCSTETDSQGRFRLEDLPAELGEISASREGYGGMSLHEVEPDRHDVRLVLKRRSEAGQIRGIVHDKHTGAAIHPVTVKVSFADEPFDEKNEEAGVAWGLSSSVIGGLTWDFADGSFKIRNELVSGIYYRLAVTADGYYERALNGVQAWPLSEERRPIPVELERGDTLIGQVVDAITGEAVPDVKVRHGRTLSFSRHGRASVRSATTGARGTFEVEVLSPDPAALLLEKSGFARTTFFRVGPGPDVRVFRLLRGAVLEGTVRTLEGDPVSGARVSIRVDGREFPRVTTDAQGSYRVEELPSGGAEVKLLRKGTIPKQRKVALVAGEVTNVDFTEHGGVIVGTVTDGGAPVPRAPVLVRNLGNAAEQDWIRADAEGSFRLDGLTPGRYEVGAKRPDRPGPLGRVVRLVDVPRGEAYCEVALSEVTRLSVLVIDHLTGDGVPQATVELYRHAPEALAGIPFRSFTGDWLPHETARSTVKGLELEVQTPGVYFVAARREEGKPRCGWLSPLELKIGQEEELTLTMGGPAALTVSVLDGTTEIPVEGASIYLSPAQGYPVGFSGVTDASGAGSIDRIPPGNYRLEVRGEDYVGHREAVRLGEEPVARTISLEPASWTLVRLEGPTNRTPAYWLRAVVLSGGDPGWPSTTREGNLPAVSRRFDEGRNGEIEARLKARSGRYRVRFEVQAGAYGGSPVVLTREMDVHVATNRDARVYLAMPRE